MPPDIVRSAGNLEKISTSRHSLGIHRSIAVTGTYRVPDSLTTSEQLRGTIWRALGQVIKKHAALCCGIIDEDTARPAYIRLDRIDLRYNVIIGKLPPQSTMTYQERLEQAISRENSTSWPELAVRPSWKLLLVSREEEDEDSDEDMKGDTSPAKFDIVFSYHHALLDGLSGFAFHRALLQELRYSPAAGDVTPPPDPIVVVPSPLQLAPPVEEFLKLKVSRRLLISKTISHYKLNKFSSSSREAPFWSGSKADLPDPALYISRLRSFSIGPSILRRILRACHAHGTTLTAVLHGIIVVALARLAPTAEAFTASTPYSVRGYTGTSPDELVNQVSIVESSYSRQILDGVRGDPTDDSAKVYALGRRFLTDLQGSRTDFPVDNMLSVLAYLKDFHGYFSQKLGQPRAATFEVSNLGVFSGPPSLPQSGPPQGAWGIDRMLFTQCGSVVGNSVSFNCASVAEGPLTVSLTWQKGALDESLVEDLAAQVEKSLRALAGT
ncbi:MAG: hypothetical protein M1825_000884 [Sarcosagium campestre]|nr:MAG: hypothetical protein M1825_000884 [Sarcosagium campestre]